MWNKTTPSLAGHIRRLSPCGRGLVEQGSKGWTLWCDNRSVSRWFSLGEAEAFLARWLASDEKSRRRAIVTGACRSALARAWAIAREAL